MGEQRSHNENFSRAARRFIVAGMRGTPGSAWVAV
jgi:hypothetical protein